MSSELVFSGGAVTSALTIKSSPRAKVMRLRVDPRTGEVLLTLPRRASRKKAIAWVEGHRGWIQEALEKVVPKQAIGPGTLVPFRGVPHPVSWVESHPRTPRIDGQAIILGGPEESLERRILRWLGAEARTLLARETLEFANEAGVTVTRVGVGDPTSRWGSCSSSGTIRYSWRLIMAPDFVRRATVAHEVAHRIHMNHGPAFHALVKELLGQDPKPARLWLKREGATLHRIG